MDTLWILESNSLKVSVCPINSLRLAIKDDPLHLVELISLSDIDLRLFEILIDLLLRLFKELIVIKKALLSIECSSSISALHELFDQPLKDWEDLIVIKTLDLMCCDNEWTLHFFACQLNFLREFNLLSHGHIIFEFDIHIVIGTSDTPAHTSEDLVEWIDIESCSEVPSSDKKVLNVLKQLSLLSLVLSDGISLAT